MDKKTIDNLKTGCTVWGQEQAKIIRELKKEHPSWITIIDNMDELEHILGKKFDGIGKLPYFGAILTEEGKENLSNS